MGALLIIVGVLILDIMAIVDVRRADVNNTWAFIVLMIVFPVFGFSIWYIKKSFFFSCRRKVKGCKTNGLTTDHNHDMTINRFRILLERCTLEFKQTESYTMLISNAESISHNDSEAMVDNVVKSFETVIGKLTDYLTDRECVVAILLSVGADTRMISRSLFISDTTVRTYKTKIKAKLPKQYYLSLFANQNRQL